ncbi:hypothetical protein EVAR_75244_1 [Eumeta japonica]|uniref:Uncharacterized protein n=1 Tax=Eumeta variegata TaxID=151549 RepID=A0A4C1V845_EUMVA|nr:hypothetical protein EVAR_75244_1 [Eumeta japonica]
MTTRPPGLYGSTQAIASAEGETATGTMTKRQFDRSPCEVARAPRPRARNGRHVTTLPAAPTRRPAAAPDRDRPSRRLAARRRRARRRVRGNHAAFDL